MSVQATSSPKIGADARGRRLESWKEIAAYLRRDVNTVRRSRAGLPLRWDDGGADCPAFGNSRAACDLAHFSDAVQGHAEIRACDWERTKRRCGHRRLGAAIGRQDSCHCSVDSGRYRRAPVVWYL